MSSLPAAETVDGGRPWKLYSVVAALGFLASFLGSWQPSFWEDEVATISAATRPFADLPALFSTIDLSHGLYYLVIHLWTGVAGISETALRFPSAVAAAIACAGMVALARRFVALPAAVAAGLILAVLPRVTWAGSEARSAALSLLLAVFATLLLTSLWKRPRPGILVAYGVLAVLGTLLFFPFALLLPAHLLATALCARQRLVRVGVVVVISCLATAPFLWAVSRQSAQADWIGRRSLADTLANILLKQYFYGNDRPTGNTPPAWILASVGVLALLLAGLAVVGLWTALRPAPGAENATGSRSLALLGLCWILVPSLGLGLVSLAVKPIYEPRYLTFTAPGLALLAALGLAHLHRVKALPALLAAALILVTATVPQLSLKSFVNVPHDRLRDIAVLVHQTPGVQGVVYGRPENRQASMAYPQDFTGVKDLSLASSPAESGTLWGVNRSVPASELHGTVLYVGDGGQQPSQAGTFAQAGCRQVRVIDAQRLHFAEFRCP